MRGSKGHGRRVRVTWCVHEGFEEFGHLEPGQRTTEVVASDDWTLERIAYEAQRQLDWPAHPTLLVPLREPWPPEERWDPGPLLFGQVNVVNDAGVLTWNASSQEARLKDIDRAVVLGVQRQDLRPFEFAYPLPIRNGFGLHWNDLVEFWINALPYLATLAALEGVAGFIGRVARFAQWVPRRIHGIEPAVDENCGTPTDFLELMGALTDRGQLATLIGIDAELAREMCNYFPADDDGPAGLVVGRIHRRLSAEVIYGKGEIGRTIFEEVLRVGIELQARDLGIDLSVLDEPKDPRLDESSRLDAIRLRCSCLKPGCGIMAGFDAIDGGMKVGFTEPTDHFVFDLDNLRFVADLTRERIAHAKRSRTSGT